MTSAESSLRQIYQSPSGSVAWVPGLVLVAWHGAPGLEQARALREAGRRVGPASPAGVVTLAFFEGGFPIISDDVWREVGELVAETASFSLGTALVLLQPGFATAVVRAFVAGLMFAARSKEALAAFPNAEEAARWARSLFDEPPLTEPEMLALVEGFLAARPAAE